jgi:hypothetical protein
MFYRILTRIYYIFLAELGYKLSATINSNIDRIYTITNRFEFNDIFIMDFTNTSKGKSTTIDKSYFSNKKFNKKTFKLSNRRGGCNTFQQKPSFLENYTINNQLLLEVVPSSNSSDIDKAININTHLENINGSIYLAVKFTNFNIGERNLHLNNIIYVFKYMSINDVRPICKLLINNLDVDMPKLLKGFYQDNK